MKAAHGIVYKTAQIYLTWCILVQEDLTVFFIRGDI